MRDEYDVTHVPWIARTSVMLGLAEAVLVAVGAVAIRMFGGVLELVVGGLIVLVGLAVVTLLPAIWTKPRSIEGIAGAAGIGLGAAGVFLLLDVAILQPLGVYTNRWYEIGGFSNWWYHPVWWMVGSYLPMLGAVMLAAPDGRAARSPGVAFGLAVGATLVVMALAVVLGFPGAGWNLGTFAVAFIAGLTVAAIIGWMTARRA